MIRLTPCANKQDACFGTLCKRESLLSRSLKGLWFEVQRNTKLGRKGSFSVEFWESTHMQDFVQMPPFPPGCIKQDCILGRGRCSSCCFDRKRPQGRAGSRNVFLIAFLHFEAYEAYPNHTMCRLHCPKCRCFVKNPVAVARVVRHLLTSSRTWWAAPEFSSACAQSNTNG